MRIQGLFRLALAGLCIFAGVLGGPAMAATLQQTARGVAVETDRYRATIENGVLVGFLNKLTGEEYLDPYADPAKILPHLPSGLGTQGTPEAFAVAADLYHWPWWEHPTDLYLPNQHYADAKSRFTFTAKGEKQCELAYADLTDGKVRYAGDSYLLAVQVDDATGDLLLTPSVRSDRPGVYAANVTVSAIGPNITIEAPIFDGIRITRDMKPTLWSNEWGGYWDYAFLALNGRRTGAVGVWAQDAELKYYKHLFYLINEQGISFSLDTMNIPPFDALKDAKGMTWRFQAFDKSWAQAAARFRAWREKSVKIAPRPAWTRQVSLVNGGVNAGKMWLDYLTAYLGKDNLSRTVTFAPVIRAAAFDTKHWDNTPYPGFKTEMQAWKPSGARLMAYLQPMIMWGVPPKDDAEAQRVYKLHQQADTRHVFQKDPNAVMPYVDQHHLGQPEWQQWFLNWVHAYIADNGADGVYHDQSYHCPIDNRGLVGGMTSPQGMADYFYKAATRDPDSIHGTEHMTEVNNVGASLGIGSGILWGTAPSMRRQRIDHASPISNALHYPNGVMFGFPHYSDFITRGDATFFHWGMDLMERRGEIAGVYLQNGIYNGQTVPFNQWVNEIKLDHTRALTFVNYGLRPVFPEDWDCMVRSYFTGVKGENFRYEDTPWGSRFVEITNGQARMIYGRIHGVTEAQAPGAISGWPMYNAGGPSGLNPDRYYCLDPYVNRPATYFSGSLYESYVEDGCANETLALLKIRPLPALGAITSYDKVVLHAPAAPKKVWVNGQPTAVAPDGQGAYVINFQTPADIVVLFKDPAPGCDALKDQALFRMVCSTNMDIFNAGWMTTEQLRAQRLTMKEIGKELPSLSGPGFPESVHPLKKFQLHLAVAPPAGAKAGRVLIYQASRQPFEEFAVNGVPQDVVKKRKVNEPLEVRLKEGESAVLSFKSVSVIQYLFEWVED